MNLLKCLLLLDTFVHRHCLGLDTVYQKSGNECSSYFYNILYIDHNLLATLQIIWRLILL